MCAAQARVATSDLFHFYGVIFLTCQHTIKARLTNSQAHGVIGVIQSVLSLSPSVVYLPLRIQLARCVYGSLYSCIQAHQPFEVCTVIIIFNIVYP